MFLAWTKENHIWSTFLAFTKLKEDIPPWHRLKFFSYFFANFRVNMLYSTAPSKKQHFKLKIRIQVPQSFCTKLQASNFFILAFFFPHCEAKLISGVSCSQLNFGIEFRLFISFLRNFTDKENKENLIFWLHCDKILFREKALFCGRLKFFA